MCCATLLGYHGESVFQGRALNCMGICLHSAHYPCCLQYYATVFLADSSDDEWEDVGNEDDEEDTENLAEEMEEESEDANNMAATSVRQNFPCAFSGYHCMVLTVSSSC